MQAKLATPFYARSDACLNWRWVLLSSVDDSLQSCLIHTISGINGNLACEQLLFCILDSLLRIIGNNRLVNIVVSKTYNAVLDSKDLVLTVRKCSVNCLLNCIVDAVANALDRGRDDEVCLVLALVSKCLVGVNTDAVLLTFCCCLDNTYGCRTCCYESTSAPLEY